MQGVVEIYDPQSGAGVIIRDSDRQPIYLRSGSLRGSLFRTLRQGQRVVFEVTQEEGVSYATSVRLGSEGQ